MEEVKERATVAYREQRYDEACALFNEALQHANSLSQHTEETQEIRRILW